MKDLAFARIQLGRDLERTLRIESTDLFLPLHDESDGHGLHATRRQRRFDLPPKDGRYFVPHQAVQNAPSLLRIHQMLIDGARFCNGLKNSCFGYLVENNPLGVFLTKFQCFEQVPRDGLALPVFVACQPDGFGVFREAFELVDQTFLIGRDFVMRNESVLDVDGSIPFDEVADVTLTRADHEVLPEILLDGLGLGG